MRRAFLQLSGGGAMSKLLGILRELLLANYFGTGMAADSFRGSHTLTLNPTHLFTRLLQASFVPLYAGHFQKDDPRSDHLFLAVFLVFMTIGVLIAALLFTLGGAIVRLVLPGFTDDRVALAAAMLRLLAPGVPFYIHSTLLGALGAARGDFIIPALRPGVQNAGMIIMIVVAAITGRPALAAAGFTTAYILLSAWATMHFASRGMLPRLSWQGAAPLVAVWKPLWRVMRPLLLLSIFVQGNILVERFVTSLLGPGRIAALDYARFLSETAHFLIAMPLGLMSLSIFAKYTENETRLGADKLLALLFLFFLPLSAFLFLNGNSLIAAIFLRGEFDTSSLYMTERALTGLSAGLWLYSGSFLLQRILNARLRNSVVLRAESLSVAVNIAFNLLFYRQLGIMVIGFGVALASLCSMIYYIAATGIELRLVRKSARVLAAGLPLYFIGANLIHRAAGIGYAALAAQLAFACLLWGLLPLISADLRELIQGKLRKK